MTSLDAPSPNRATLRVHTSTYEFGEDTNIQSITSILQMNRLRYRGVKRTIQSHTVGSDHLQSQAAGSGALPRIGCAVRSLPGERLPSGWEQRFPVGNLDLHRAVDSRFWGKGGAGRIDVPGRLEKDWQEENKFPVHVKKVKMRNSSVN